MLSIFKIIPTIFQIIALIGPIREALRAGQSVFDILREKGPALIDFVQKIGEELFPSLKKEDAVQAGALRAFDQEAVKAIQVGMNKLENAGLTVDGSYGEMTKKAVEAFQKKHGLEADGWAGKLTQAVMNVELAKLDAPEAMAKVVSP